MAMTLAAANMALEASMTLGLGVSFRIWILSFDAQNDQAENLWKNEWKM